jgi:exopolysaccharide biosynthesis protein
MNRDQRRQFVLDHRTAIFGYGRRSGVDAGLELGELARLMISFGAREAINLDSGGSATLVHRGHLLNRPYSNDDQPAPQSRPVVTALVLDAG